MNVITVSGKTLDLYEDAIVNLNIQINDISDLSTRNSTYSNSFSIPKTSNNQEIFEFVGVYGNTSRLPYQKINCKYTQNGIPLITNGYLQITNVGPKDYKVVMYDGIIDLSEALKDKKLSDLALLEGYNHTLSEAVYTASFTATTEYVYAFADYGVEPPSDSVTYPIEYQVPSLFVHNIFNDILTEAGFTFEGEIFNDADYLSLLAAPSDGYEVEITPPTVTNLKRYDTNTIADVQSTPVDPETDGGGYHYYDHTFTQTAFYNSGVTLINSNTVRADFTGRIQITMSTDYTVDNGYVQVFVKRNGGTIKILSFSEGTSGIAYNVLTFLVNNGDEITMDITAVEFYDGVDDYLLDFSTDSTLTFSSVAGGQLIDFQTLYGDVSQTAFLKDIMQRYGMLLIKDLNVDNHLKFTTFETLLQDKTNAEDWTNKLVDITNESLTVDGYGRNNNFKYKYESDVDVFDYDGVMTLDNEHIVDEKTLINSIFKIRLNNYSDLGLPIYHIPLWEEKTVDGVLTNVPKKTELTLFKKELVNDSIQFNSYSGSPAFYTGDVAVMTFSGISFQHYVDTYYDQISKLLLNNKSLSVTLNLNNIDINNLDFFKLKYLKQTGKYYYLNSVKSSGGRNATAELVEINN